VIPAASLNVLSSRPRAAYTRAVPKTLPARLLFFLALGVGAVMRVFVVFTDDGIYWPDEIYQSFEPAHRLVFGYGLVPWEYIDGARTWALPGFVAGILELCKLVGLDRPTAYIPAVKLVFVLVSLGTAWGVYRLARVLGASELAAATGSALFSVAAPVVYFAPRAMSENLSALPVMWGLALVLEKDVARKWLWLGASLLGCAVLFRLQTAVFCVGALAILGARKQWPQLRDVFLVLCGWAVLFGLLDAATWHDAPGARAFGLFHSAVVYLRFNLLEGRAAGWGTAPWFFYVKVLFKSMPGLAVVLLVGLLLSLKRAPGVAATALAFFVLHSLVGHKEYRFLLPVLPLFFALVSVGLEALTLKRQAPQGRVPMLQALGIALALFSAGVSALTFRSLTFGDLGAYAERAGSSAWDDFGAVNRLLLAGSRQADLCGLRIDVAHLAWTGGSTYLHRNAPLYMGREPPQSGHFNYVLTRAGSGLPEVATDSGLALVHLPAATCVPDPGYTWRLP